MIILLYYNIDKKISHGAKDQVIEASINKKETMKTKKPLGVRVREREGEKRNQLYELVQCM